jgi:hypothetical protein
MGLWPRTDVVSPSRTIWGPAPLTSRVRTERARPRPAHDLSGAPAPCHCALSSEGGQREHRRGRLSRRHALLAGGVAGRVVELIKGAHWSARAKWVLSVALSMAGGLATAWLAGDVLGFVVATDDPGSTPLTQVNEGRRCRGVLLSLSLP